ncbi:MAG: hypothetical protein DLM72_16475 [Candidatus Nitrosopolaris wilkensis]|nr:MAG: hypothetical protein DLM72_16475 [Candidatus Nitrosopolaris wilkensis]
MSHRKRKLFPRNLKHDPDHVLDGMLVLECFFCGRYKTPIEFDMKNHLLELHKGKLISALPVRGKGFDIDYRIEFAVDIMKRKKPIEFYDHRATQQEHEENGIDGRTKHDDNSCSQSIRVTNREREASLAVNSDGFKDLSIKLNQIYREDCLKFMDRLRQQNMHVDVIVTSPPYNIKKKYDSYNDNLPESEYLSSMYNLAKSGLSIMKPTSSFFLNIGSELSNGLLPLRVAFEFEKVGFKLQNTIIWLKSICIDKTQVGKDIEKNYIDFKDRDTISTGHWQPNSSPIFLSGMFEYIFHFSKYGDVKLDKKAVGVEKQDKSNIKRFGSNVRDRGNVWFITQDTRNETADHPASFPIEVPTWCIKLHGIREGMLVYDPFSGFGTTALASINLGVNYLGTDTSKKYCDMAQENIRNFAPLDKF